MSGLSDRQSLSDTVDYAASRYGLSHGIKIEIGSRSSSPILSEEELCSLGNSSAQQLKTTTLRYGARASATRTCGTIRASGCMKMWTGVLVEVEANRRPSPRISLVTGIIVVLKGTRYCSRST
jgi:hypothetical protein